MRFSNPILSIVSNSRWKRLILVLILNLMKADGFDTLTDYEEFDVAVQSY